MLFLCLFLKFFIDCQCISLTFLTNSYIYNQKDYIIKIFYYTLNYIFNISKIACHNLQNI